MSGGYFDYTQYHLLDIIEKLVELIDNKGFKEYKYSDETIIKFRKALHIVSQAEVMIQRIDWLVSGDDNESSFHERWNEELDSIKSQFDI
jgi:hypothetical protein